MFKCNVCDDETEKSQVFCRKHNKCGACGAQDELQHSAQDGILCSACAADLIVQRVASFVGETHQKRSVICPHCGQVVRDGWGMSDGEKECDYCGRRYDLWRELSVVFSTRKVEPRQ